MLFKIGFIILILGFASCKEVKKNDPQDPKQEESQAKTGLALKSAIPGNYRFQIRTFDLDEPYETIGYLKLEEDKYVYTAQKESPIRFSFVYQNKGTYSLQFEMDQDPDVPVEQLTGESIRIGRLEFDYYSSGSDPAIKSFFLAYDPEEKALFFQSYLEGVQLWEVKGEPLL